MKKAVLDTNTIISGLISTKGSPGRVLALAFEKKLQIVTSEALMEELADALTYPRVVKALQRNRQGSWTENDRVEFLRNFRKICHIAPSVPLTESVSKDLDDDMVLSCAIQAKAKLIVSGDKDLIDLKEYKSVRILTPLEFLSELAHSPS
jgi:putative PIN family toxin of toxin-antitoxin system